MDKMRMSVLNEVLDLLDEKEVDIDDIPCIYEAHIAEEFIALFDFKEETGL